MPDRPDPEPAESPVVTADPPASPMATTGMDHVTLEGTDVDGTIRFYRDLLGMPLVLRQPNLDRPELTHLFFDAGDGRLVTFFVSEEREPRDGDREPDPGHVHHLAFRVDGGRLAEVKAALDDAGHEFSEFDRGAFHSLYTRDHNGLTIELVAEKYAVPDDRRAAVLARAQAEREADGAEFVDDEHVEAALAALGLPVERRDVPDADAGRGVGE